MFCFNIWCGVYKPDIVNKSSYTFCWSGGIASAGNLKDSYIGPVRAFRPRAPLVRFRGKADLSYSSFQCPLMIHSRHVEGAPIRYFSKMVWPRAW